MIRFFYILFGIFCSYITSATEPLSALKIEGKRIINYGNVYRGDTITHNYTIKCNSDVPLIIKEIQRSCNCTKATISKDTIAFGDSAILAVNIDTKEKIGYNLINVILQANTPQREHVVVVAMNVIEKE